ncbi:hypothetical protein OPIT5_11980 [Opitutaceae bacterium TAV5]|nr:hypothetical protein OPIT5_11980 [Opitutaceae bacterium TAV5]
MFYLRFLGFLLFKNEFSELPLTGWLRRIRKNWPQKDAKIILPGENLPRAYKRDGGFHARQDFCAPSRPSGLESVALISEGKKRRFR